MPVNLSVKNAPDEVVRRLKARAARHHRSLQGELMAILEAAVSDESPFLTPREALQQVRTAGLSTPATSARLIRASRDARDRRRR